MQNFTKLPESKEKEFYGGAAITATTVLKLAPLVVTAASKIVGLIKAVKSRNGEINKAGTIKWDNKGEKEIIYQPVAVSY